VAGDKKPMTHGMKAKRIAAARRPPAREHAAAATHAVVTVDRRDNHLERRKGADRRVHQVPVAAERRVGERRVKVNRRRQIDPTTCERDYTPEEVEFMSAMDNYKRRSGRMFPTCSEVLEVIRSLGYARQIPAEPTVLPTPAVSAAPMETPMAIG
jgi:hypothetical protein